MLEKARDPAVDKLAQEIAIALRILVTGEICTSFVIRVVAMRLMHLGCQVYVVGENITPSIIRAGDLLIACCESGSTNSVCAVAHKARQVGTRIVGVTTQTESVLGKMSDIVIKIAAAEGQGNKEPSQSAISLFEQYTLLLFDALFYVTAHNLNKSAQSLWALHTNFE